jgi:predicted nucleotidyltransferase
MQDSRYSPIKNLDACLAKAARRLAEEPDVIVAYLFGSQARGDTGPLSDIDVAVLLRDGEEAPVGSKRHLELLSLFYDAFHSDAVDVVPLNHAPYLLQHRILRDGKVFFCRDELARVRYEAQAISKYLDFRPFEQRYFAALMRRIKAEGLGVRYRRHQSQAGQAGRTGVLPQSSATDQLR